MTRPPLATTKSPVRCYNANSIVVGPTADSGIMLETLCATIAMALHILQDLNHIVLYLYCLDCHVVPFIIQNGVQNHQMRSRREGNRMNSSVNSEKTWRSDGFSKKNGDWRRSSRRSLSTRLCVTSTNVQVHVRQSDPASESPSADVK